MTERFKKPCEKYDRVHKITGICLKELKKRLEVVVEDDLLGVVGKVCSTNNVGLTEIFDI